MASKRRNGDFITALMSLGRNGDSDIGHLTEGELIVPREILDNEPAVLSSFVKAMSKNGQDWRPYVVGQGRRNPNTGLQEFAYKGDKSIGSSFGKDPSATPSGGGGRNQEARQAERNLYGQPGAPTTTTRRIQEVEPQTYPVGSNREPSFAEGGPMGSAGSRPGGPADVAGDEPGMFERLLNDALGAPSGRSLGALQHMFSAGPIGPLMGFTSFMQNVLGIPGEVDWEPGNPNPGARESSRNLDHRSPTARRINQIANAAVAAGLIDPPGWLKRSVEGLTPLQQRAHIATRGTAGGDSSYRGRDAFDYYRGLITNTPYENVLPVEHQYLRDIWGANYGGNTSSLMQALARI